jgi:hypothetical protein
VGDAETPAKGVIEVTNASGTTSITLDGDAGICSATAPIDVKACYGAKGNGTTDDTAAIQAAVNAALARNNGGEVLFPSGLYRVTGTVNVGLPLFDGYSWLTDRTGPMDDAEYNSHVITANQTANASKPAITVRFEQGAALLADFAPSVPTPVLAYNLRNGNGQIINLRVLGTTAVSAGKEIDPSVKASNKLIGIVAALGLKSLVNTHVSGLQHGVVSVAGYWSNITNSRCHGGTGT